MSLQSSSWTDLASVWVLVASAAKVIIDTEVEQQGQVRLVAARLGGQAGKRGPPAVDHLQAVWP